MTEQKLKKECEEKWKSLTLSNNFIFQKFINFLLHHGYLPCIIDAEHFAVMQ